MTDTDAAPTIGHNRPPEPTLFERTDALVATCNKWLAERSVIVDEEVAGAAQDFMGQLRLERDKLEAEEKTERQPLDRMVAAIRIKYRHPARLLGIALVKMSELVAPYLKAKDDRLKREAEERRKAAEDARRQADAAVTEAVARPSIEGELAALRAVEEAEALSKAATKPAGRAQVRGDYSAKAMSLHSNWKGRVVDEKAALRAYAKHPDIRAAALAAIVKVASKHAKEVKGDQSKALAGIEFYNDERVQ